nr:DUF6499 domain-containing protein [Pseudodesulfovibrio sp.]
MIIQDWTDENNYLFPDNFPRKRWAWEFLRRNPDYQQTWEEAQDNLPEDSSARWKDPSDRDFVIDDTARAKSFGLKTGVLNPLTDYPVFLDFIRHDDVRIITGTGDELIGPLPNYSVAIIFNIQKPLGPQLEEAKTRLNTIQRSFDDVFQSGFNSQDSTISPVEIKKKAPTHKDLWPTYLRVLDARQAGCDAKTIAKKVFPHYHNEYPEYYGSNHVLRIAKTAINCSLKKYREIIM